MQLPLGVGGHILDLEISLSTTQMTCEKNVCNHLFLIKKLHFSQLNIEIAKITQFQFRSQFPQSINNEEKRSSLPLINHDFFSIFFALLYLKKKEFVRLIQKKSRKHSPMLSKEHKSHNFKAHLCSCNEGHDMYQKNTLKTQLHLAHAQVTL